MWLDPFSFPSLADHKQQVGAGLGSPPKSPHSGKTHPCIKPRCVKAPAGFLKPQTLLNTSCLAGPSLFFNQRQTEEQGRR